MKKLLSLLVSAAVSACMLTFASPSVLAGEAEEKEPVFTLTEINGKLKTAVLESVKDAGRELNVPAVIDGYKLVGAADKAFFGLADTVSITLPPTLRTIGANAFTGCLSLESIELPENITSLGADCFTSCTSLKSVNIPSALSEIPENCFYACTALGNIEFPANITKLGDKSFYGCLNISGTYIPPTVTEIGEDAVGKRYSLVSGKTDTIPDFELIYTDDSAAALYAEKNKIARTYFLCDADLDNKITAADASLVLKEYTKVSGGGELSFGSKQKKAADVNKDGKIDARDSVLILRRYNELQML